MSSYILLVLEITSSSSSSQSVVVVMAPRLLLSARTFLRRGTRNKNYGTNSSLFSSYILLGLPWARRSMVPLTMHNYPTECRDPTLGSKVNWELVCLFLWQLFQSNFEFLLYFLVSTNKQVAVTNTRQYVLYTVYTRIVYLCCNCCRYIYCTELKDSEPLSIAVWWTFRFLAWSGVKEDEKERNRTK